MHLALESRVQAVRHLPAEARTRIRPYRRPAGRFQRNLREPPSFPAPAGLTKLRWIDPRDPDKIRRGNVPGSFGVRINAEGMPLPDGCGSTRPGAAHYRSPS
jgi:hypothetical protein